VKFGGLLLMASILTCTFDFFAAFFPVPAADIVMDAEEGADSLLLAGVGNNSAVGDRGCGALLAALDQVPAAGDDSAVGRDTIQYVLTS
jgi:hypothetical protein